MPRTVVHPRAGKPGDSVLEKLAKYVPAETVAFYVPAYAIAKAHGSSICWAILTVGLIGTIIYLVAVADSANPPRWYFYLLSGIAFIVWAMATSSVEVDLFQWGEWVGELLLFVAVFLIPIIDKLITRYSS